MNAASTTKPFLFADTDISAHSCRLERKTSGALIITGPIDGLKALRNKAWDDQRPRNRVDLCLVLSYKIDGIEQAEYPRIEVHPSVAARIAA